MTTNPWLKWVGGSNEPDAAGMTYTNVITTQQNLWAGCSRINGVTVVGPTLTLTVPNPEKGINNYFPSLSGDQLDNYMVVNGIHFYPPYNPDLDDGSNRGGVLGDAITGTNNGYGNPDPNIITMWHPTLHNSNKHSLDPAYSAYYTPIFCLSAYRQKCQAWILNSLFDFGTTFASGLFPSGFANPRPFAYVIKALYALMGPASPTAKSTFSPGKLDYTITGLPGPINSYSPFTGGQSKLFQGDDGLFRLLVWNSQNDPGGSSVPVSITFNSGPRTRVREYDVSSGAFTGTFPNETFTPLQDVSNVSVVNTTMNACVRLFLITY